MGEDRFLDALGAQAEREMERITAMAEEEAGRIREEAFREARREGEERLGRAEAEARGVRARIVNAARLEARRTVLSAIHDLVDKTVEQLQSRTRLLRKDGNYRSIVEKLIDECSIAAGSRMLCSREDADLVKSIVEDRRLEINVEAHDDPGTGIVIISGDGTFIQRNTFAERIRRARPQITMAVAARVLPGGEEV